MAETDSDGQGATGGDGHGQTGGEQPNLTIITQYVKDISFENPGAPDIFRQSKQPNINISIGVQAHPSGRPCRTHLQHRRAAALPRLARHQR